MHISAVCSSCFYDMRDLRRIRLYLDLDSAKLPATALVSSCLDYCHLLLYVITDMDVTKLRRVQNRPARIATKSPPFTRSVPPLRFRHWLPVKFRVLFKISMLTYKILHEKQPVYLHSMLAASSPFHSLRSKKGISLSVPRESRPIQVLEHSLLCPFSLEQPATVCPFSHFSCCLQETSEDTSV